MADDACLSMPLGDAAELIAAFDWAASAVGAMETWPASLRTASAIVLKSPVPMVVLWGRDGTMIYNDAYADLAGVRHPGMLGRSVFDGWPEMAAFHRRVMDVALAGGTLEYRDRQFTFNRCGQDEVRWLDIDYSPLPGDDGRPMGVLAVVVETTARVTAERERAAAEAALREERDRAHGVLDNMGEAFVLLDSEFRYVDMNAEAVQMEMRPKAEFIGHTPWDLHPHIAPELTQLWKTAMAERRAVSLLHNYMWPDARDTWVDMRAFPVGEGLAIFYRDVTERVLADNRLRASEARQSFLLQLGDAVRDLVDADEVVAVTTRALGKRLGVSRVTYADIDEAHDRAALSGGWHDSHTSPMPPQVRMSDYGMPMVAILRAGKTLRIDDVRDHPVTADHADALTAIDIGAMVTVPLVKRRALVATISVQCSAPHAWSDIEIDLIEATAERTWEALERARAEAALRASEARLREANELLEALVDKRTAERDTVWMTSRDLLAVTDPDGVFRAVNPAWQSVLGLAEEELIGRSCLEFIHPDDRERTMRVLGMAGQTDLPPFENRYRHRDGTWRTLSWLAVTDGVFLYGCGRDVTAERAAAQELATAQEALRQSQKMEAMGQLTGGVAHDFNNLLTPIVGALDLLQTLDVGGAREKQLISGAAQSAERARALVQRLLAFARRQPLQPVAVDVAALVDGMTALLNSTLGPQIRLTVKRDAQLPPARADANQLEMALLNLVVNARDAMAGCGRLTITLGVKRVEAGHATRLPAGDYVTLAVADTGHGMDKATLSRAVEPFFSTKGVGKGTGLGLSMVHGLTQQLGGATMITSQSGLGTEVEMWLPQAGPPVAHDASEASETVSVSRRGTVLLVDDEEVVRLTTAYMLAALGYDVVEAASGSEALALISQGLAPDILVTDHIMPGMTGTDLAHKLRRQRPDMKILVVSGYANTDGITPDLPRLAKPFRSADLAASLGVSA